MTLDNFEPGKLGGSSCRNSAKADVRLAAGYLVQLLERGLESGLPQRLPETL